ncbi:unnamed protein product [Gongylonema pulchrum]|uniref:CYSTM domain-containing protein n=1 Tax=Gongylonema pulchrum TaxID=637853 RepID=A0A183EKM1_9BILA|nr:unnamed protein product [Gongylonema pulchrum]
MGDHGYPSHVRPTTTSTNASLQQQGSFLHTITPMNRVPQYAAPPPDPVLNPALPPNTYGSSVPHIPPYQQQQPPMRSHRPAFHLNPNAPPFHPSFPSVCIFLCVLCCVTALQNAYCHGVVCVCVPHFVPHFQLGDHKS